MFRFLATFMALLLGATVVAQAQTTTTGPVKIAFSLSALGARSPSVTLGGLMSTCTVTVSNGAGFVLTPQAASDGGPDNPLPSWSNATTVGNGYIDSLGSFSGEMADVGATNFSVLVSGYTSGAISGVLTCSGQVARSTIPLLFYGPVALTSATPLPPLYLNGQSQCAMVLSGSGAATVTPKGSADNGVTYTTVAAIGAQTTNGTYGGDITPYLSNFYVDVSSVTGTVSVTEVCSPAVAT